MFLKVYFKSKAQKIESVIEFSDIESVFLIIYPMGFLTSFMILHKLNCNSMCITRMTINLSFQVQGCYLYF